MPSSPIKEKHTITPLLFKDPYYKKQKQLCNICKYKLDKDLQFEREREAFLARSDP